MSLPSDRDLMPLLDRIGQLADSPIGAELLGMLQVLGRFGADASESATAVGLPPVAPAPEPNTANRLGIWRAVDGDTARYVRARSAQASWRRYADIEEFALDPRRRHVVLVGESAPRGFLYDPLVTPGEVLQETLQHCPGLDDCDVVDLASTGALLPDLLQILDDAAKLEPDAVIVFAGNNWQAATDVSAANRQRVATILREEGAAAARDWLMRYKTEMCVAALKAQLRAIRSRAETRVVIVVPEFNLADWNTCHEPLLPDGQLQAWRALHLSAQAALAGGEFAQARADALAMTELDRGMSEISYTLLERCDLEVGSAESCYRHRQLKRDAACGRWVDQTPRCPTPLQAALREMARAENYECVDLPDILRDETQGMGPGREWFLDYCHLNLDGIHLAMAHVATGLARSFGASPPSLRNLLNQRRPAPGDVEAAAHFLAAIHASHYGQSGDLIRYHCDQAIAKDPAKAARLMAAYESCSGSDGPTWMSPAYRDLVACRQVARYLGPRDESAHQKRDETPLFEIFHQACEDALGAAASPFPINRVKRSRVGKDWLDLLSDRRIGGDQQGFLFGASGPWRSFYGRKTRHRFWADGRSALQFEITVRLPQTTLLESAEIALLINGEPRSDLVISRSWRTFEFEIAKVAVAEGENLVELILPPARVDYRQECERVAREIQAFRTPSVEQAWAQVFAFRVRTAPLSTQRLPGGGAAVHAQADMVGSPRLTERARAWR